MVGSVVLNRQGQKVGEGYHVEAGSPHAEVHALNEAGRQAVGGTLYVNLEPCNHTGRTPPCTERIIQSKVARVVIGTLDPNPQVAGQGRDRLQNAQISVRYGLLEPQCQRLNAMFFHYITTQRPYITVKMASTWDGKVATRSGQSQWITGPLARQVVHRQRAGYGAILTTAATVEADNPQLTVRCPAESEASRNHPPLRVVLDRTARLDPTQYQIFKTDVAPTCLVVGAECFNPDHLRAAQALGVEILYAKDTGEGLDLKDVFKQLGQRRVMNVFVEAGGRLAGTLLQKKLAQRILMFMGPKLLPDTSARPVFNTGDVLFAMDEGYPLSIERVMALGEDVMVDVVPA